MSVIINNVLDVHISGVKLKGTSNPKGYFVDYPYEIMATRIYNVKPTIWGRYKMWLMGFTWVKLTK